jgi:hypothetical protein
MDQSGIDRTAQTKQRHTKGPQCITVSRRQDRPDQASCEVSFTSRHIFSMRFKSGVAVASHFDVSLQRQSFLNHARFENVVLVLRNSFFSDVMQSHTPQEWIPPLHQDSIRPSFTGLINLRRGVPQNSDRDTRCPALLEVKK